VLGTKWEKGQGDVLEEPSSWSFQSFILRITAFMVWVGY
jgi:hypothetical protein